MERVRCIGSAAQHLMLLLLAIRRRESTRAVNAAERG